MRPPTSDEIKTWRTLAAAGDFESLLDCDTPVLQLIAALGEYESAICWDTTCLNCSRLFDRLYAADMKIERIEAALRRIEKYDATQRGAYGAASRDAVNAIRRAMEVDHG